MGTFGADLRYAVRMLRSNPAFTAIAVAALALGIGANTAIFTVVNTVLLQPLPYPQPDRIMQLGRQYPRGEGWSNSIPKYMAWRDNDVFESMTLFGQSGPGVNLGAGDRPEQAKAVRVSEGFFRVFATMPAMGRTFTSAEDLPNGPAVMVLSHGLWQSRFAADPNILGRAIPLDGKPTTVVGVMPKGFVPDPPADLWVPLQADPASTNQGHYLRAAGRLKPGVSVEQAKAAMKVVGERFRAANPKWMDKTESVAVVPLRDATVGGVRKALLILTGAVGFVLLIACANVANLLLARAAARQKELAVRAAIGASRGRVLRQLLTESVLLALIGGSLGFVLGSWGVRGLLALSPGEIPRLTDADGIQAAIPALDWQVAAFTMAVALGTSIVFGLLPALQTSNPDLAGTLKDAGGRGGVSRAQNRARSVLVASEIALALVLLIGASLLIRTFVGLRSANPGIDARNVWTFETAMGENYSTTVKVDNLTTQAVRRLESLPGVEAAASMIALPITNGIDLPFNIAGKPAPAAGAQYHGDEQWRSVSPHYFQVFRIPVLRGRAFRETDTANSARVLVINEAMAKKYWPNEDALGQVLTIGKGLGPEFEEPARQVIGIVGSVRETSLRDGLVPVMYVPQSQQPEGLTKLAASVLPMCWAVRSSADPVSLRAAIAREVRSVDPLLALTSERPMTQVIARTIARQDFNMMLLTVFAVVALLLAAIGVYGVMAYSVERRMQEMGIRMALDAARGDLLKLVLGHGMKVAGAGVIVGLGLAYATTRLLESLLFDVKPFDPLTFGAVAAVLTLIALFATYIPARRAAAIAPSEALRY
jgi:putative ABC transport system permease protein